MYAQDPSVAKRMVMSVQLNHIKRTVIRPDWEMIIEKVSLQAYGFRVLKRYFLTMRAQEGVSEIKFGQGLLGGLTGRSRGIPVYIR